MNMEMKEAYVAPEVKVVMLELEGVIASSNNSLSGIGDDWGGEYDW